MIPFADLVTQHARLRLELEPVIEEVMFGSEFVLGRHVAGFEDAFARYCGAESGIGVNSGTSALHLALLAAGVGSGDEVITTAFTFVATVAAIGYTGATPVLVDVDPETLLLDVGQLEAAITPCTRAIVPVHLYGHPADMDPILSIARRHGLVVIEDAAQAHGATYHGRRVGSLADAGCFSFYPSKNLGAAGDAGMIVTSRPEWAARLRRLRDWGQSSPYRHVERGFNSRMAGIQAAVLGVKLRHLDEWIHARRANAARYDASIDGPELRPLLRQPGAGHAYHIYAVRCRQRERLLAEFRRRDIDTRVHYPDPIHLAPAWSNLGYRRGAFPHAERAAREVLSVPVHPELTAAQVDSIASALQELGSLRAAS